MLFIFIWRGGPEGQCFDIALDDRYYLDWRFRIQEDDAIGGDAVWGLDVPEFLIMPDEDELIGENKDKPPVMKITFKTPEQLQSATNDIQELIDRKYKGAFYSVSAGEL